MKATHHSPDLLIVEDRPWIVGFSLTGFILAFLVAGIATAAEGQTAKGVMIAVLGGGMGLLAFWAFVRRAQVVFHRPEGWVEIRRRSLFQTRKVRHRLDEISRARLEHLSDTSRITLVIESGQSAGLHPITESYTSGDHAPLCDTINDWLSGKTA